MKHAIQRLMLTVLVAFVSLTASAYDFEVDGVYYEVISLSDLTCKVVSDDTEYTGDVTVPSTVTHSGRTLSVISIGSAFSCCESLTSVNIGENVTSIDGGAFWYCKSLTSVVIPNSVTSIGDEAFEGCSKLGAVVIPNRVSSIGNRAFYECTDMVKAEIGNSVTTIGEEAFYGCTNMAEVVIGNSVKKIGNRAFYKTYMHSIFIPKSVTYIGDDAFGGSIQTLNFEDGHSTLRLGNSIYNHEISGLFNGRWQTSSKIHLGRNIEFCTFRNRNGGYRSSPFCGLYFSTDITIGDSVTVISDSTFYAACMGGSGGDELTVTLGKSVLKIGDAAFMGLDHLYTIKIPNSVECIGDSVFLGTGLKEITIGNSLKEIGCKAFAHCDSLMTIKVCNPIPPNITDDAGFSNKQYMDATVYVPVGSLAAYQSADVWKNFWNIKEDSSLTGIDKVKISQEKETKIYNLNGQKLIAPPKGLNIINGKKILIK